MWHFCNTMLVDFRVFGLRDVVDSWEDVLDFVFYGFRVKCVFTVGILSKITVGFFFQIY